MNRFKRAVPALVEWEIYTRSEFQQKNELQNQMGSLLETIWHLRKIRWMESIIQENPYEYHRQKASRSIKKSLRLLHCNQEPNASYNVNQLGEGFRQKLRNEFHWLKLPIRWDNKNLNYSCPHLGFRLSTGDDPTALTLSSGLILTLIGIIPHQAKMKPLWLSRMRELMNHGSVRAVRRNLLINERLNTKCATRNYPSKAQMGSHWLGKLSAEISLLSDPPTTGLS